MVRASFVSLLAQDRIEEASAGVVQHAEDTVEPLGTTVIGVWDIQRATGGGRPRLELAKQAGLPILSVRGQPADVGEVVPVHRKDEVEGIEVTAGIKLPGDVNETDAMASRHVDRSCVGRLANVPATCSTRVDGEAIRDAPLTRQMTEDPLGEGGTTDVAHAEKEQPPGAGHVVVHRWGRE